MGNSPQLPTTILYFDHTAALGGGEISLLNLVTHLDRKRFEPVVVLASDGPLRERLSAVGVETHVLLLSEEVTGVRKDTLTGPKAVSLRQMNAIVRYVWRLRTFASKRGVDILHTNSLKADIIGALAGRSCGLPVIWHVRDRIADDYLPPKTTIAFRILCRFLPNYVVVNSAATLDSLRLPRSRKKQIIYNGIVHDGLPDYEHAGLEQHPEGHYSDTRVGSDDATPQPAFALSIPRERSEARPVIGLVGRISPWKGQDIFLRAAALVRKEYPHARFQIIGAPLFGEEKYEAELRALTTELRLESNVEWLGFRSDVMHLVSQMTMLVHASKTGEPFGQVIVESMLVARPVVATNGGGVPEIVVDGQTGLLIPMNDVPSMANAMLRLLKDRDAAEAMGQAGRRHALQHFTIQHTVEKVSRLYADVLEDRRRQRHWRLALSLPMVLIGLFSFVYSLRFIRNSQAKH